MIDKSCEQASELMAAAWLRELDEAGQTNLQAHLDGCETCATEMAALGAMWQQMGDLPVSEPGSGMRARWQQTMALFAPPPKPVRSFRWSFWPANPVWQVGFAVLCLAIGLACGAYLQRGSAERDEVARLRAEVTSTKQLVALALLQQQSAVDRLRGVDYSSQMSLLEPQIVTALIDRVNRDSNVNVRLAAIDALGKVAGESGVRVSLQQALPQQDSPMVQAALIDYLVDARDKNAVGAIRDLVARPDLNPTVRERATYAVHQLAQ